jgi:shikimate dehydrogenase
MKISGAAKIAGVIGWPIAHSLSPLLHGHWIEAYRLDAAYVPFACAPEAFTAAIAGLRAAGIRGLNVTVPHKEAAFRLADKPDFSAQIAGAANLLVFGEDGVTASNTDQPGLIAALNEVLGENALKGRKAVVLGAGGMARAAICGLAKMGIAEIAVLARNTERAEALAAALEPHLEAKLTARGLDAWELVAPETVLAVNATSAGMKNLAPLDLKLEALPKGAAVFDAVYNPLETDLLRRARAAGLCAIDGLGLLMHQAAPSFAAFFGIEPKVDAVLKRKLVEALAP